MGLFDFFKPSPMAAQQQDPLANVNPLLRIGIGLGGPEAVENFRQAAMEKQRRDALAGIDFGSMKTQDALARYAEITGDPSSLLNYRMSQEITPYQQAQLDLERARLGASMAGMGADKRTEGNEKMRNLAEAGLKDLDAVSALAFDPATGDIRRSVTGQGIKGEGRTFDQGMERAVANAIYIKTGAAATPGEIKSFLKQYSPNAFDTPEQARAKIQSLRGFFIESLPSYASYESPDPLVSIPKYNRGGVKTNFQGPLKGWSVTEVK